ncbi:MAG: valine--tRNA ligase [Candidatus Woesearchaeota archaeon]
MNATQENQNETPWPKKYKFKDIEEKWKTYWEQHPFESDFTVDDQSPKKVFSVDTPPPTVSGQMHMGHAFSYAQGDFIVRFHRMLGDKIFYPFGTDDNGLPTEHLIERLKKINSKDISRPDFVKLCHETIKEIKPEFIQAWKNLAISADYKNSYSTISKEATRVSQKSFLDLYKKGFIYKKETPTTWCTTCQTAIAQADFENIEKTSFFHDIAFTDDEGKELIIATTRPELIPACVALFAHPDDKRYQYLKGKKAKVPLFNYEVPVLFDPSVALEKGTGLMMVCTFGDKEDVEKWHKYDLELRTILNKDGTLNELAQQFSGLKSLDARIKIVEALKECGALKSSEKITHNANTHDRCGTEIEFIKTSQWFINVMDYKDELVALADNIDWHPTHMKVRYVNWVKNLNWDWCISRQRHFGVPFPVWYEKDTGNIITADESELPIDPTTQTPKSYLGNPKNLLAEPDVLDTWATSSLTPQIALEWGKTKDEKFEQAMPMTIRLQAHDIIRTWAFYTITKSYFHHNCVPWKNIMVSGFVLDKNGKKMSKSKGNVVDPTKLMELFGSDAVRYAASAVKLGDDLPFQEKYVETGKKTATKLFNAAKFAHMNLTDFSFTGFSEQSDFRVGGGQNSKQGSDAVSLLVMDKWILLKMNAMITNATTHLENYEYAKARSEIENFFWTDFCDNYLEIVKDRIYKADIYGEDSKRAGQYTLAIVLLNVTKCFAPYLPFITEEIYSWRFAKELLTDDTPQSIHTQQWPKPFAVSSDLGSDADSQLSTSLDSVLRTGDLVCKVIGAIRAIKSREHVSQKHEMTRIAIPCLSQECELLKTAQNAIKRTCSVKKIEYIFEETSEALLAINDLELDYELAPKDEN